MKTKINNLIFIAGGCWLFIGVINLAGAMICTLIIDDFNPHDEVKTFTLIMGIVGVLWLIRKIIGTEPKDDGGFSDWHDTIYHRCDDCDSRVLPNGKCTVCGLTDGEEEMIKSAITEEMFNEAIHDLNHDDRNDAM